MRDAVSIVTHSRGRSLDGRKMIIVVLRVSPSRCAHANKPARSRQSTLVSVCGVIHAALAGRLNRAGMPIMVMCMHFNWGYVTNENNITVVVRYDRSLTFAHHKQIICGTEQQSNVSNGGARALMSKVWRAVARADSHKLSNIIVCFSDVVSLIKACNYYLFYYIICCWTD